MLEELRRGRSRAWIGANFGYPTSEELAAARLPQGLFLLGAVAGTGAARPGSAAAGELLTAVDGRAVGRTLAGWCAATRGHRERRSRAELERRRGSDGAARTVRVRFG